MLITGNHHLQWSRGNLNMADHRWAGLAVLDAARDAGNRWIFPELLDEGLEPWGKVGMVLVGGSPNPTHGVDVTDFIELGIKSLQEHKVYIENLSQQVDPDEMLRWNASIIGEKLGCEYAIGFEVVRI